VQKLAAEESLLGQSLGRLMAVVEAYPDLKANETMAQMTEELTSTENKISFARQAYNDSVMEYNTARETFPNSVVAQFFAFKEAALYELENNDERKAPKVSFQ
jgi:LemA protein